MSEDTAGKMVRVEYRTQYGGLGSAWFDDKPSVSDAAFADRVKANNPGADICRIERGIRIEGTGR